MARRLMQVNGNGGGGAQIQCVGGHEELKTEEILTAVRESIINEL